MQSGDKERERQWRVGGGFTWSKDAYRMRRLLEIGGCQDTVFANEFPSLPAVAVVVSVVAAAVAVDDFA